MELSLFVRAKGGDWEADEVDLEEGKVREVVDRQAKEVYLEMESRNFEMILWGEVEVV